MAYIDDEARDEAEATGMKNTFWRAYKQRQDDKVKLPGIGGVLGMFTDLRVRRFRALFEMFFGPKPGWV